VRRHLLSVPAATADSDADSADVLSRLRGGWRTDRGFRIGGWTTSIGLTLIAFLIRFPGLAYPNKIVFDETYYAKDAWTLLHLGYEGSWPDSANDSIVAGNVNVWTSAGSFIVHPPIGKWLIAMGEQAFGMNSFGWRFPSLVFGCLLVFITVRLIRRVSRSNLIGGLTGLLLCLDGLDFVMSRIALLDVFLAFFLIAAVACLAADRDWFRDRLAQHLERYELPDLQRRFGPALMVRPWRIAAGVCFGLALGTKWNALYILAAFALLSLAWDVGARRLAGARTNPVFGLLRDGIPAFISLVVLSGLLYVVSWAGWFATSGGWDRQWGAQNPDAATTKLLGKALASWVHYQKDIWDFHSGDYIMHASHTYNAYPGGWLFMIRTIGIDAVNDIPPGTNGCPVDAGQNCLQVISGLGTPLLWWLAAVAFAFSIVWWVGARDWRFGIMVVGTLSAWLPWFAVADRPEFFFYAITIIPFTAGGLALTAGLVLGPAASGRRRFLGGIAIGVMIALIGADFIYIYPLLTDGVLTYSQWLSRMWLRSWI